MQILKIICIPDFFEDKAKIVFLFQYVKKQLFLN